MERLQERGFAELLTRFESGGMSAEDFAGRIMDIADLQLDYASS